MVAEHLRCLAFVSGRGPWSLDLTECGCCRLCLGVGSRREGGQLQTRSWRAAPETLASWLVGMEGLGRAPGSLGPPEVMAPGSWGFRNVASARGQTEVSYLLRTETNCEARVPVPGGGRGQAGLLHGSRLEACVEAFGGG